MHGKGAQGKNSKSFRKKKGLRVAVQTCGRLPRKVSCIQDAFGLGVPSSGVQGLEFRAEGLGFRAEGLGFRVHGGGSGIQYLGFVV